MSAPGTSTTPSTAPWWSGPTFHLAIGGIAIGAGLAWLALHGDPSMAAVAFGGGLTLLGVGGGVAASSSG